MARVMMRSHQRGHVPALLAALLLAVAAGDGPGGPGPPPWGQTPFFGGTVSTETSDALLRRQAERYGADLSDAVNKLRDTANAARSASLQAALLANVDRTVSCWQDNLAVLEGTLLRSFPRAPAIGAPGLCDTNGSGRTAQHQQQEEEEAASNTKTGYDDVYQIFHHITRDWSVDGAPIRRQLYEPLVSRLAAEQHAAQRKEMDERSHRLNSGGSHQRRLQVLVPGSGLGRLAYELARADLSVTGVEVSTLMLSVSFALFNTNFVHVADDSRGSLHEQRKRQQQQLQLFPYIHDEYNNEMSSQDRYGAVLIPDVQPSNLSPAHGTAPASEPDTLHLSFLQADFVQAFLPRHAQNESREDGNGTTGWSGGEDTSETISRGLTLYDAVVTCFLIDAVNHVEDAIAAIHAALQPGGLWLNCGPLQWHENAVMHLALDELLEVVRAAGFEVVEVKHLEPVAYRSARDAASSTRPMLYRPVLWAARRI